MQINKARSPGNISLTPLAEKLIAKAAAPARPDPEPFNPKEWISTAEAARLTGYSRRHILTLCDQGFFIEGADWKQRPPRPGSDQGGRIRIRRSALSRLEGR